MIACPNERCVSAHLLSSGAMHDLYRGERYWFNTEDENVMTENNQEFQVMPVADQLFHEYFRGAKEGEECEQLLAIEILQQLQHDSKIHVSICSIVQFGRILQRTKYLLCIRNAVISTK